MLLVRVNSFRKKNNKTALVPSITILLRFRISIGAILNHYARDANNAIMFLNIMLYYYIVLSQHFPKLISLLISILKSCLKGE